MLTAAREECPHGSPVGCHECDMRLAEPLAGGPRADPGLWPGRHTEADDLPKSITRRPPGRGSTALTRDLARTGAAGVPSWAPAPPRPAVSLTGAALLVLCSLKGVYKAPSVGPRLGLWPSPDPGPGAGVELGGGHLG